VCSSDLKACPLGGLRLLALEGGKLGLELLRLGRLPRLLQNGDPPAKRLYLLEARVELRLDVLDGDVLGEDRAQRREADDRLLDASDRDPQDEIGGPPAAARAVVDRAHVAAEGAGQAKRSLRRAGEVLDAKGQLG